MSKLLAVVDGAGPAAMVQNVYYSYHARLGDAANVLRYDSPHATHHRDHHVHRYDVFAGDANGVVTMHGAAGWPTLGDVLCELRDWYHQYLAEIEALVER